MAAINAFVGHSFNEADQQLIYTFIRFFNSLKGTTDFDWDHAERAELKALSDKVREKMEGKNLFIGILTKKSLRADFNKIKGFMGFLYAPKKDFEYDASDWIIQESGYGLAKCGRLLFIIEQGVNLIAGLQGDLEYVSFDRNNPESCFTKLMEIIGSIIPQQIHYDGADKSIPPSPTEEKPEKRIQGEKDKWIECYSNLYELVMNKRNFTEAEDVLLPRIIESIKNDEYDLIYWKSCYFGMLCRVGEKRGFAELKKLREKYPDSPYPNRELGDCLLQYRNYQEAAQAFVKAAGTAKKPESRVYYIGKATDALAKDNHYDDAYGLAYDYMKVLEPEDCQRMYKHLATIAQKSGNDELFFCFSEKFLSFEPADGDFRFSLAYRYNEVGKNLFALYHYKILCETNTNGTNLNNIGVVYDQLEMNYKSVLSYEVAADTYNETLSMANLANKFVKQGFLERAKEQLNRARALPDYHKNVDINLAEIAKHEEHENNREREIITDCEKGKNFFITFAEAYATEIAVSISGLWNSKHGQLEMELSGGKVIGRGEILSPEPMLGLQVNALSGLGLGLPNIKKRSLRLNGQIRNRGILYELSVQTEGSSLLLSENSEYTGYMIISADSTEISVMEYKKANAEASFYTINKATP